MARFGDFQREIYALGNSPLFTTRLDDLEELARKKLTPTAFNYVRGSAGMERTYRANINAFDSWRLLPRMLREVATRDCGVTLFGQEYVSPFFLSPIGVLGIVHEDGEEAAARAAASQEVPYCMSNAATRTIEQMGEACGDGPRWFQLYWPETDEVTISHLNRAKAAGCKVLVVTLDCNIIGFRPSDLDKAYLPFLKGIGGQVGLSDPVRPFIFLLLGFRRSSEQALMKKIGREPLPNGRIDSVPDDEKQDLILSWLFEAWPGIFRTWEDLALLRKHWDGALVLKGINTVEDAQLAIKHKADGIIVSNHGGRQVDGARAALDSLAAITADPQIQRSGLTVLFDSGVRSGSDAIKALALGAKAVGIGRPYAYGLGLEGEEGVKLVLRSLLADFDVNLGNMGCGAVSELSRANLARIGAPPTQAPSGLLGRLKAML